MTKSLVPETVFEITRRFMSLYTEDFNCLKLQSQVYFYDSAMWEKNNYQVKIYHYVNSRNNLSFKCREDSFNDTVILYIDKYDVRITINFDYLPVCISAVFLTFSLTLRMICGQTIGKWNGYMKPFQGFAISSDGTGH